MEPLTKKGTKINIALDFNLQLLYNIYFFIRKNYAFRLYYFNS
jgi:hypothetical protein